MKILPNQDILKILLTQASNNRLAHVYLFFGSRDCGAEEVIRAFSEQFLQISHTSASSVNHSMASKIPDGLLTHPDFLYFQKNEEIGKEAQQIKEFIDKIYFKPFIAKQKIVYIPSLDSLNWHSMNALLKVIEEPTAHTIIFLTAQTRNVLPTLISRCQIFNLNKPRTEVFLTNSHNQVGVQALSEFMGKSLAERMHAVNIFAELDDSVFLETLENFTFELAEKLTQLPELYTLLRAGLKAIEDFNTNKNKKFIMQGIMLKI
jgi:DNA polymerase III delta prime subunit